MQFLILGFWIFFFFALSHWVCKAVACLTDEKDLELRCVTCVFGLAIQMSVGPFHTVVIFKLNWNDIIQPPETQFFAEHTRAHFTSKLAPDSTEKRRRTEIKQARYFKRD